MIARLGSVPVILISLVVLSVATLTTNIAANVVSPANDFANLAPRSISFRAGGMITAVIGILMMPWYLYNHLSAYIFTWLLGYSALLGPIAGIMLCDYYILRKTNLNLHALYASQGEYTYHRGINWRAVIALVLAVAPNVPGFVNALAGESSPRPFPPVFDQVYGYAWFIGLLLGGLIYYLLMRFRRPRG